jgi:ABC-type transport system involved in cytochrome bd biosynthesis fused ATPase/permease subunit
MSLLTVKDLKVSFGGIEALKGISFSVEEGAIVTLIGANGAGKSTTLRAISGLVRPAAGTIHYAGEPIGGMDTQKIVEKGIALVPEGRRVFPNLTVLENLLIGAYMRTGKSAIDREHRARVPPVPPAQGAALAVGGHAVRRRAADAGGGPRADEPAQDPDDGRAVAGPGADGGAGHLLDHPHPESGGASRFF